MNSKSKISPINQRENEPTNQITVFINYKCEIKYSIKCDENEKTEIVLGKICSKNKLDFNSLYFLYNGKLVTDDDYKKPIKEIIGKIDQQRKIMEILSYQKDVEDYSSKPDNDEINLMIMLDSKEETQGNKN